MSAGRRVLVSGKNNHQPMSFLLRTGGIGVDANSLPDIHPVRGNGTGENQGQPEHARRLLFERGKRRR